MQIPTRGALALPLLLCAALAAQEPAAEASPAAQLAALKAEFDQAMQKFQDAYQAAKTDAERDAAYSKLYPHGEQFVPKVKAIALAHPTDPVAAEAIVWALQQGRGDAGSDALLDILIAHHLDSAQIAEVCQTMQYAPTAKSQEFLRTVKAKSKRPDAQGWATYVLAKELQGDASYSRQLRDKPEEGLVQWLQQSRGEDGVAKLKELDADALDKQAEQLLEEVAAKCADVKTHRGALTDLAKADLFELRNLAVGKVAPDIEGKDTEGVAFKLSDYRGKVVFLDFWGYW